MMRRPTSIMLTVVAIVALVPLLLGCGATLSPTASPTQSLTVAVTKVPPAATATPIPATAVPPTATPKPQGPTVGGTLVYAFGTEPTTLDAHKGQSTETHIVLSYLGASLVCKDPASGSYVPYLAESWKVSADGLVLEFTLKKGVKFHDGTPLTAKEYAWTLQRAMDPATKSPSAGPQLGPVASVEAVDDYTLRLNLKTPSYPLFEGLALASYLQPLPKAAVDKLGDQYGRQPIGVGPYKFKEWKTGEKIVLERNPDYNWGPAFVHQGPFYIQTIEFRIIPEYSTILAALEAGEVDLVELETKDVQGIKAANRSQVFEALWPGMNPFIAMNTSKPPFDDVKMRKAFNLAVDRQALIKTVALGNAVPQWGPISPSVTGYWPGVEKIGYGYDLAQAKSLMKEAGYVVGAGGLLEKDGKPLKLVLKCDSTDPTKVNTAQVLQDQFKALGVSIEVQQLEQGVLRQDLRSGNYEIGITGVGYGEADLLFIIFHSSMLGIVNYCQVKDPKLDQILESTRTTMDAAKRQEAVNQAQQYIVEQAYAVPLYAPKAYYALSNRVKGSVFSLKGGIMYFTLDDAYIQP